MTITSLTKIPGTITGVSKVSCLWQLSEWYLASGKRYRIQKFHPKNMVSLGLNPRKESCFVSLMRKVSFLIFFLPIGAALIRKSYRKKYFFKVQTKPKPVVPKPTPIKSPPAPVVAIPPAAADDTDPWFGDLGKLMGVMIVMNTAIEKELKTKPLVDVLQALNFIETSSVYLTAFEVIYGDKPTGMLKTLADAHFKQLIALFGTFYRLLYPDPQSPPPQLNPTIPSHQVLLDAWKN